MLPTPTPTRNATLEGGTAAKPRGLSLVAKRLAGWTSNLLVLGLVLVVGLTFGRQITSWWALGPSDASAIAPHGETFLAPDPLGDAWGLQHVTFGNVPMQLGRQTVTARKAEVFTALRAQCRADAESGLASVREPGADERKMLSDTTRMKPVAEEPGKWKMYEMDGPIPLVVVTAMRDATTADGQQPAPARVLCWGLAFPVTGGTHEWTEWTLFSCVPTEGLTPLAELRPALPLPPGARPRVSLRSAGGGGVVLLDGTGEAGEWLGFFDTWFQKHGWSAEEEWRTVGRARHRRYLHQAQGFMIDVVMEVQGDLRAVLTVTRQEILTH